MLKIFGGVQMKFRNVFFGFLKTWLLIAIFYSGSLYADTHMYLTLNDYHPVTNDFRPYLFERDPNTGKSIKVFDTENDFQFKTYSIRSEADMILYRQDVVPTLREWGAEIYQEGTDSYESTDLSTMMELEVEFDSSGRNGIIPKREVNVATYKGRIEAVSYSETSEVETPEIITLAAKPEGLVPGQTTNIKGGGSSLLENLIQKYKVRNVRKIRLYSIKDDYYYRRGWKNDPNPNPKGACGNG